MWNFLMDGNVGLHHTLSFSILEMINYSSIVLGYNSKKTREIELLQGKFGSKLLPSY